MPRFKNRDLGRVPGGPDPAREQHHARCEDEEAGCHAQVSVKNAHDLLPFIPGVVAQSHEDAAPQHCARVSGARECPVTDRRRSGGNGSDMTHARHEVSEGEEPVAEADEPPLSAGNAVSGTCSTRWSAAAPTVRPRT